MTHISSPLSAFRDIVARQLFGITLGEAKKANICISCKKPIKSMTLTHPDIKEYLISGLCPKCFDKLSVSDEK